MKRCCDCKKIVWPWQQSYISYSPIHRTCHIASLARFMTRNPDMAAEIRRELLNAGSIPR